MIMSQTISYDRLANLRMFHLLQCNKIKIFYQPILKILKSILNVTF